MLTPSVGGVDVSASAVSAAGSLPAVSAAVPPLAAVPDDWESVGRRLGVAEASALVDDASSLPVGSTGSGSSSVVTDGYSSLAESLSSAESLSAVEVLSLAESVSLDGSEPGISITSISDA